MIGAHKFNVKTTLAIVSALLGLILTNSLGATEIDSIAWCFYPTSFQTDTTKPKKDTLGIRKDSVIQKVDSLTLSKDALDAPVEYEAADSGIIVVNTKKFYLYGKAKTLYKDMSLEANTIQYDQTSQMVKAFGSLDTSGSPQSKPKMKQGDMESLSDTIAFNFKTQRGLTQNTYYKEGELFVNAQKLKKIDEVTYFGYMGKFTTCNLDTPHFAIRTRKLKMISNKVAFSGPASPEFEGVPIPLGLPFAIFPLKQGRSSGFLPPQFTASEDFGLGLEGLGFYKVVNDNLDVTLRTNLYSFGGWTVNINPKYLKRYKYQGMMNLTVQNVKTLNRDPSIRDPFRSTRSYMLTWSHTRDNRARPGTNFSANVNFGSTQFNSTLLNNPFLNFTNQLSSSISYSKDFNGKANLSLNANHNQNNNTKLITLTLPNANFNVVTMYPFQKKDRIGSEKWYEKLGIAYSGNLQNQINVRGDQFNFKRILDTLQWGAQHNIPITLSLPSLGPITIAPSVQYQERWYGQSILRSWNDSSKRIDTVIQRGLYTGREMSFGIGFNTRIFGTYLFKKGNVKGVRHEIRPTISANYRPNMSRRDWYDLQVDTTGRKVRVSRFDGGVLGAFSEGTFGGMSFGIDNLLEMKVKNKDTTDEKKDRIIKLLDGFGFNSSYNFLADSFQLGNFNIYARSTLFEKINITATATLDPYETDNRGFRRNSIRWNARKLQFGRITNASLAVSTQWQSKPRDERKDSDRLPKDPFMTPDEQQRQLQFARANPAEFTDFNIPWSVNLSYSLNFSNQLKPDFSGFQVITHSSLNFQGDFSLTPQWKVGATGFYDFNTKAIQQLSMFITREMHCWQLAVNVNPIGLFRSFNITINPKSGILRDLRINRARTFSNQ